MELYSINRALAVAGGLTFASLASGAGFTILEQSVSGLGNAFAGGAAAAEDASTMFFNPAGLSRMDSTQVQVDAHYLVLNAYFKNRGSTTTSTGAATTGGNSEGGFSTPVPSMYFVQPINGRFTAGISVNCPFGLGTEYDKDWVGRYMAVKSQITTVDVSPTIAWKVTDRFSVGVGFDMYYIDANLTNFIDLNKDGTSLYDGFLNMKADDDAYGYHVGALYQVTDATRIGLSYRSEVKTHLKGTADFTLPSELPGPLAAAKAVFVDQGVFAELTLPSSASFSVFHNLNDKWDVMADVTWTDWSTFKYLDINFVNPTTEAVGGKAQYENWQDTFRYSVGATYHWSDSLKLRGGFCYDSAAVRGPEYRTPRIPDAERFWIACGATWQMNERSSLDFAYTHIFVDDPEIDNSLHTSNQHLVGTIEAYMDIVSVAYTYTF
jgi:long-chain fatty acid transport protein